MMIYAGRRRRTVLRRPPTGFGSVAALVVGTPPGARPGELWSKGMAGLGQDRAMGATLVESIAGDALGKVSRQLAQVELALKISTAAALAGLLVHLFLGLRRHHP